jgi:hypothetical protein
MSDEVPARHELKYLVDDATRASIRRCVEGICELDPYSARVPGHRYEILSLYLDTPGLLTHRMKTGRAQDRFKLRLRTYAGEDAPVVAEVKRRFGEIIHKTRARVPSAAEEDTHGAADFTQMVARYGAEPKLLVRYEREAWVSLVDEYARVTFDYALEYQPQDAWSFEHEEGGWLPADDPGAMKARGSHAILELKFGASAPGWMASMARDLELWRVGYSKYCTGVEKMWGKRRPSSPHRAPVR